MSIPPIPHSNFLIQSLHAHAFLFSKEKPSHKFKKEITFKGKQSKSHKQERNHAHPPQNKSKHVQKETPIFTLQSPHSTKKFPQNPHFPTSSSSPKNHFPKTQVHLPSNALVFSFKRQRVFPETLRGFLPNASGFWRKIRLFRPISPHFLLQIHPNTRFLTGSIPSTSLLRGVLQGHTQKNAKFRSSERKQKFAF